MLKVKHPAVEGQRHAVSGVAARLENLIGSVEFTARHGQRAPQTRGVNQGAWFGPGSCAGFEGGQDRLGLVQPRCADQRPDLRRGHHSAAGLS